MYAIRSYYGILADIWPSLKPGGLLIYSTCTYNTHEDEENLLWMQHELGAEVLPVDTHEEWGIKGCLIDARLPVYRFMPHITKGEGFFLAVLRKPYGVITSYSIHYTKLYDFRSYRTIMLPLPRYP